MNIGEHFFCSRCMRTLENEGLCPYCGYDPFAPVSTSALEEGVLLHDGRYQLGAVIGMGGFGITYAAWDYALSTPVAIKEYFPASLCERDGSVSDTVMASPGHDNLFQIGLLRFGREARFLSVLQNIKNVVTVLDWFEENQTAYIVMEYVRGVTLDKYVRDNHIQPQQIIAMMREIVDALVLIHSQGILHRDISPSNILVQDDGTLKLIDFGAAASEERRIRGKDRTVIYNRQFAPIEQYEEDGKQGGWTDVYSLSATFYYLICGELPAESISRNGKDILSSISARNIRLKKWQEKAIMEGLILQPDKRIQSMELFRAVLYHLPLPEEVKRRRIFIIRTVAAAICACVCSVMLILNFTYGFYLGNGIRCSLRADGFHVVGYAEGKQNVFLPEKRMGIPVTKIREGAFQDAESLVSVTIPGTIKEVGKSAFNNCRNLTTVTLCSGVEEIGSQAFANCGYLQTVFVPDSISSVQQDTFDSMSERLLLLGNLDSRIAELAFTMGVPFAHIETEENSTGLTLRRYETNQETANLPDMIDGVPITEISSHEETASVFPSGVRKVILPRYLQRIGDYAFYATHITGIDLPETLQEIGKSAFSQSFLESVSFPDAVSSVGESAFAVCVRLEAANLSSHMLKIPDGCFEGDSALQMVGIPAGVKEIGNLAFSRCNRLEALELPVGISIINKNAFMDCVSLKTVYLPSTLQYINATAFNGCPNALVLIGFDNTYAGRFAQRYEFSFYNLNDYDTGYMLVSSSGNLMIQEDAPESESVELPTYTVFIPKQDGMNSDSEKRSLPVKMITVSGILDAAALKSRHVILPAQSTAIATEALYANRYLESVSCPDTLRDIGSCAFAKCEKLFHVSLQEGVERIGDAAFASCPSLENIALPDTLKHLGSGAFENCTALAEISIPSSLVLLNNDVFADTGLSEVTVPGNIAKCRASFYGCKKLKTAILEEGVRTLWGTFAECEALENVTIPESMEQISRSAFLDCGALRDVWIYSDDVELDYVWAAVQHVDYMGESKGTSPDDRLYLEQDSSKFLFSDSPSVTIHAHRGSSAHEYAITHGLRFEAIPDSGADRTIRSETSSSYVSSEKIFSDEQLIQWITPQEGDVCDHYWPQFRYALGYGFRHLALQCLDYYERAGQEYDRILARSARLFLEQADMLGYTIGAPIAFFEDFRSHPTLLAGDIIVEIDGQRVENNDNINRLKNAGPDDSLLYTILRANEDGILEKHVCTVTGDDPLIATRIISPLTFEQA